MLMMISENPSLYKTLEERGDQLEAGMRENLKKLGLNYQINRVGSMFTLFFTNREVIDYASAKSSDTATFANYFTEMLQQGMYFPPSQFETAFLSTAHTEKHLEHTLTTQHAALKALIKRKATN